MTFQVAKDRDCGCSGSGFTMDDQFGVFVQIPTGGDIQWKGKGESSIPRLWKKRLHTSILSILKSTWTLKAVAVLRC